MSLSSYLSVFFSLRPDFFKNRKQHSYLHNCLPFTPRLSAVCLSSVPSLCHLSRLTEVFTFSHVAGFRSSPSGSPLLAPLTLPTPPVCVLWARPPPALTPSRPRQLVGPGVPCSWVQLPVAAPASCLLNICLSKCSPVAPSCWRCWPLSFSAFRRPPLGWLAFHPTNEDRLSEAKQCARSCSAKVVDRDS